MAHLNPYLSFENNCREAMSFYQSYLGGDLFIQTVAESPAMAAQMPVHMKDSILHSSLTSGNMTLMASDLNREKPREGNTIQLCINCETEEELQTFFNKLSAGGQVIQPIEDMPWGGRFGELIDQFGKHWIFNFQS